MNKYVDFALEKPGTVVIILGFSILLSLFIVHQINKPRYNYRTTVACEEPYYAGEVEHAYVSQAGGTSIHLKDGGELHYPASVQCEVKRFRELREK